MQPVYLAQDGGTYPGHSGYGYWSAYVGRIHVVIDRNKVHDRFPGRRVVTVRRPEPVKAPFKLGSEWYPGTPITRRGTYLFWLARLQDFRRLYGRSSELVQQLTAWVGAYEVRLP